MRLVATLVITTIALAAADAAPKYEARIRRTSYNIPHIEASNFSSLGFGEGYAQAEDHVCTIADQVVFARGERARYFGAGKSDEHVLSDAGLKALQTYEIGVRELASNTPEIRSWMEGFAAGYNEFLRLWEAVDHLSVYRHPDARWDSECRNPAGFNSQPV